MTYSFAREDFRKYTIPELFEKIVNIETVPELISHLEKNYIGLPAIVKEDGNTATYDEFIRDVKKVAAYLKGAAINQGDNVGVLMNNTYSFAVAALGIMAYGAVCVLLPIQLPEDAVKGLTMKYKLRHVFRDLKEVDELNESFEFSEISPSSPAAILMTGGTTGRSKGAVLSHTALMCGMINGCYGLDNFLNQKYYCIMPLTHVFGFIRNLLTSLYTGSLIAFTTDKKKMFGEMQSFKPSVLVIVPALAELFLNLIKAYGFNFIGGELKTIICGAASVPPYLTTEFNKLGVVFCPGYGLTEFANMVSGNPNPTEFPDSVGMLFPNQEAKLVNGELWLRGRNCMIEYYGEPEENENAFSDGWFKTGDLARFDDKGNLYIIGRSKDIIVLSNGENVSPAYIESKINELPYIQDSLVTEDVNEFGSTILKAEVLLRQAVASQIKTDDIKAYVEAGISEVCDKLQDFERISKVVIRDTDFERTPAMKIVRPKKTVNG